MKINDGKDLTSLKISAADCTHVNVATTLNRRLVNRWIMRIQSNHTRLVWHFIRFDFFCVAKLIDDILYRNWNNRLASVIFVCRSSGPSSRIDGITVDNLTDQRPTANYASNRTIFNRDNVERLWLNNISITNGSICGKILNNQTQLQRLNFHLSFRMVRSDRWRGSTASPNIIIIGLMFIIYCIKNRNAAVALL